MENLKIVHIALVGGQTMPVYLAIENSQAEEVVLIHSSETYDKAKILSEDVSNEWNIPVKLKKFEEVDFFTIKDGFEKLLNEYNGWRIEINITSGTKPWTIAMALLSVGYENTELIYISQNNKLYNYQTKSIVDIEPLGIKDILTYNQTTNVKSYTPVDDYTEDDFAYIPDIKELRSNFNRKWFTKNRLDDIFNRLTSSSKDNPINFNLVRGKYVDSYSGSEIIWDKEFYSEEYKKKVQYVKLHCFDRNHKNEDEKEFISPHAFDLLTSSGWFEYEVANILKTNWHSCHDVWMNVVFNYPDKEKNPQNEIDVVAGTGHKVLFVECKTSVAEPTDIDKFASAVKNYGGMAAKAIFISLEHLKDNAKAKCKTNSITYFSFEGDENSIDRQNQLFKSLDKIMEINNTR